MKHQLIISYNFTNSPVEKFNFQRHFFNDDEHLQNQGGEDCYVFYCQNIENQTIDARFSVIIQDRIAYSPLRATFGGIEFAENILEKDLLDFLKEAVQYLSDLSIHEIIINSYPESYLTEEQILKLENCLFRLDFQVKYTEHNYEIPISEKSFYETIVSSNHKRILRNAIKNSFIFREEINPDLPQIHAFIERSRTRKNRPMTMSLKQMQEHFKKFSKKFKIFSVYNFGEMMAVCVTVEINDKILYTLYPADSELFIKKSPLTYLFSGVYEYCQQQKFIILDLGIATDKGVLNDGLARFKKNIGGNFSKKKTYFLLL